jgi:hypothetical protein
MTFKQTLFIPNKIQIEFRNKNDEPLHQADILIGIDTFANHKNNINISPFVSDKNGIVNITKTQIQEKADNFISYGLMDYMSLESAKPEVKLYFWGNNSIKIYLGYEIDPELARVLFLYNTDLSADDYLRQRVEQKKQEKDYPIFEYCFNRSTQIQENLILAEDSWDKPQDKVYYKVKLPF